MTIKLLSKRIDNKFIDNYLSGQEEETLKPGHELVDLISGIKAQIAESLKFYYG
jgi:hypothetical protein